MRLQERLFFVLFWFTVCSHNCIFFLQKEMGTTVMKRRHIKSAGYKMVNIPFWRYAIELTADTQEQVVKTYLQKSGLRVKQN